MRIEVRMKTGFFKTTAYELMLDGALLRLAPDDPQDGEILLPAREVLSLTLREKKQPQIEILTRGNIYAGVFEQGTDFQETLRVLKGNPDLKIICEFN